MVKPEVGNFRTEGMLAFRAADRVITTPGFALGPMLVCCSTRAVVCSCGLNVPESRGNTLSKGLRARASKPQSAPRSKRLTKLDELIKWIAVVSAGIAISTGLAARTGFAHQKPAPQ